MKNLCFMCKKNIGTIVNTKHVLKDGTIKRYLACTKCNTERMRKYVSTTIGKMNVRNNVYKSILKYRDKHNSRMILKYHVSKGKIIKPDTCSICSKYSLTIQGHHTDYSKPLDVIWLCKKCHVVEDKKMI